MQYYLDLVKRPRQKIVSKKHTFGMSFYSIVTIVSIQDPNRGRHNEVFTTNK
jgi:hypothetical protein